MMITNKNTITSIHGMTLIVKDQLEALEKESTQDFMSPRYMIEKIERAMDYLGCIKNYAIEAQNRTGDEEDEL